LIFGSALYKQRDRSAFFQTELKAYLKRRNIMEVPIRYTASHQRTNHSALMDAFANLFRLFLSRMAGKLW
jgi:hypothetical protein